MREWREDVLLGTMFVSTTCSRVPGRLVSRVPGRAMPEVRDVPLNDGPMMVHCAEFAQLSGLEDVQVNPDVWLASGDVRDSEGEDRLHKLHLRSIDDKTRFRPVEHRLDQPQRQTWVRRRAA